MFAYGTFLRTTLNFIIISAFLFILIRSRLFPRTVSSVATERAS